MEENFTPITLEEFEQDLAVQLAAMRARNEAGWIREHPHFVKAIALRLWRSGMRPYRTPPAPVHSTSSVDASGPSRTRSDAGES